MREDKLEQAKMFLYNYVSDQTVYNCDVKLAAEKAGIRKTTLRRAANKYIITSVGKDGRWYWRLINPPKIKIKFFDGL